MELRVRKKLVFESFYGQLQTLDFKGGQVATSKDHVAIAFPNQTRVQIYLSEVKKGFGKGEFGGYLLLVICGGPIYEALQGAGVAENPTFRDDRIFGGTSYQLVPKGLKGYKFTDAVEVETEVKRMVKDVKEVFVPVVEMFTTKYAKAIDYILANPGFVSKPFCTCVVLHGLTNSFSRLDERIIKVKENKYFWDYHRSQSPDVLVKRIRKWFDKYPPPPGQED
jgi:hypothetical protein